MKMMIDRQTTWGCIRYFKLYKNGVYQGKVFNTISYSIDVHEGDLLTFKEGFFKFSHKIKVTQASEKLTITTTKNIKQLFLSFVILFLAVSLLIFPIHSLLTFFIAEVVLFTLLNTIFRFSSYRFDSTHSESISTVFIHDPLIKSM